MYVYNRWIGRCVFKMYLGILIIIMVQIHGVGGKTTKPPLYLSISLYVN